MALPVHQANQAQQQHLKPNAMLVESNLNIAQYTLNGSRCGWICRALKNIANFVSNIPIIGEKISNVIGQVADAVSFIEDQLTQRNIVVDYEPTASEAAILDSWVINKLQPFYKKLANELAAISNATTFNEQVKIANAVLQKICLVQTYFVSKETSGLSANAVYLRSNLIDNIFEPLHEIIENTFNNQNLEIANTTATITSNNVNNFSPLISVSGTSSTCLNYRLSSTEAVDNTPTNLVVSNNTTLPNPTTNSGNGTKLGLVALGIALIALLLPSSKKSKSES